MTRSNAEKNAATKKGGKKKASEQSANEMMEETMEEVRGLKHAAEADDAAEAEVEGDSRVLVSQTATAKKRNLPESTTPRAEATSAALSRSLIEKDTSAPKR
jgi:hypothetical protein